MKRFKLIAVAFIVAALFPVAANSYNDGHFELTGYVKSCIREFADAITQGDMANASAFIKKAYKSPYSMSDAVESMNVVRYLYVLDRKRNNDDIALNEELKRIPQRINSNDVPSSLSIAMAIAGLYMEKAEREKDDLYRAEQLLTSLSIYEMIGKYPGRFLEWGTEADLSDDFKVGGFDYGEEERLSRIKKLQSMIGAISEVDLVDYSIKTAVLEPDAIPNIFMTKAKEKGRMRGGDIPIVAEIYINFMKKGVEKEASRCIDLMCAMDENLPDGNQTIFRYLYILDRKKHNDSFNIRYVMGLKKPIGAPVRNNPESYIVAMATAGSYKEMADVAADEYKGIYLAAALDIYENIEKYNLKKETPDELWTNVYNAAGFKYDDAIRQKNILELKSRINEISGERWAKQAMTILTTNYVKVPMETALCCAEYSREKEYADGYAISAYMYEFGYGTEKNLKSSQSLYKKAAELGSLWGAMKHARHLYDSGKYADAFKLVNQYREDPDFSTEGGNYLLGLLIEKNKVKGLTFEDAVDNYKVALKQCKWTDWQEDSQSRIDIIESRDVFSYIEDRKKELGEIEKWPVKEIANVAEMFDKINKNKFSANYRKLAAEKGHERSACLYAKSLYKERGRTHGDMSELGRIISLHEETEYLPMIYNIAVAYTYGYGVGPDLDKAREYLEKYCRYAADEDISVYGSDEYIPTISGNYYNSVSIKNADPLKVALSDFNKPKELFRWARYRMRDTKPDEIWQYYLRRSASMGYQPAIDLMKELKLE